MKRTIAKIIFPFIILIIIILVNSCAVLSSPQKTKTTAPGPGTTTVIIPKLPEAVSPAVMETRTYDYTLTPADIPEKPALDMYSRQEIESFLTASSAGFIEFEDVFIQPNPANPVIPVTTDMPFSTATSDSPPSQHYPNLKKKKLFHLFRVKDQDPGRTQRDLLANHEINKWFEDRVTLVIKGYPTTSDIAAVKEFIGTCNEIIGREKFVYDEKAEAGNIIVEFSQEPEPKYPQVYVGESACLGDPLRVVFYFENNKILLNEYRAEFGGTDESSLFIKYTPGEKAFGQKNRVIKIFIANIGDRQTRDTVIIHELFHGIGFCGHAPYIESNLFPLPIPMAALDVVPPINTLIGPLGRRMIEMLYRPEILPGMTIKEAGDILAQLKKCENTSIKESKSFLEQKKNELANLEAKLLLKAKTQVERREEIYRTFFDLDEKREKLFKEVKKENRLAPILIKDMAPAMILRLNRGLVIGELKNLESLLDKFKSQKNAGGKIKSLKQQIFQRKDDIVVLDEILADVITVETQLHKIKGKGLALDIADEKLNRKLRLIVRQLWAIEHEMKRP